MPYALIADMDTTGYVYILTNPSFQDIVKIGKTTGCPSIRAVDLSSTGVPTPFVLEWSVLVTNCHEVERKTHVNLADRRVNPNREFFRISVQDAAMEICKHAEIVEKPKDWENLRRLAEQQKAAELDRQKEEREMDLMRRMKRERARLDEINREQQEIQRKAQELQEQKNREIQARDQLQQEIREKRARRKDINYFIGSCFIGPLLILYPIGIITVLLSENNELPVPIFAGLYCFLVALLAYLFRKVIFKRAWDK